MARKDRPIRIRKKDEEEFKRLKRNAKAKLRRVKKNYGKDLSGQIYIPGDIETFEYRWQFDEWKAQMKDFSKNPKYKFKKNKKGFVADIVSIKQADKLNKEYIAKAKKRIEEGSKLPYYPEPGEQLGTVKDLFLRMQKPEKRHGIFVPPEFNFDNIASAAEFYEYVAGRLLKLEDTYYSEANARMRDNFINSLERTFDSYADEAIKILKGMNPDVYYQMTLQYGDAFDFAAKYDRKTRTYGNMEDLKRINKYLELYKNGEVEIDMDFAKLS